MAGTKTSIEPGLIARIVGSLKDSMTNAWFGPMEPLKPFVPEQMQPSVEGRQFDFPVGFNRQTQPRSNDAISFPQLRALGDSCDVLRIVIETRKDQMEKLSWEVKPKDDAKPKDSRCEELENFFQCPDKENDWNTWLRMILEDLFVIDAPTMYVRKTNGGAIYAIEPMDGATIKRVLDDHGRTPMAPDPAYQQILKGIPAVDYTTEELIYRPRNKRTNKVYGYSPVEQIVMTVNIALRRAVHKLQYYTEGNIPEALIGTPETWSTEQVKLFQAHWDELHEGDTAARRHAKFVPGGLKYQPTKADVLKDEFDEWLARIVCYAFSIEPTAFVQQQNRATADTAREAALQEGLLPIMKWVKNLMNYIIQQVFGYTDLQFDWIQDEVIDPMQQATIHGIYIDKGVLLPEEVRGDLGRPEFSPEQLAAIEAKKQQAMQQFQQGGFGSKDEEGEDEEDPDKDPPPDDKKKVPPVPGKEAVAKSKKSVRGTPVDRDRPRMVKMEKKLAKVFADFFKEQAPIVAKQIVAKVGKIDKAKSNDDDLLDDIDLDWDGLVDNVSVVLGGIAEDGAKEGFKSIGKKGDASGQAANWANDRAAEMVGKKWDGDKLIDNPNAEWAITDSTRDMLQSFVASSLDDGLTMDELSDAIEESFAFSESRSDMIARTETAMADSQGQMEAFQESGQVEGTVWITAGDDLVSDICNENAAAGVIPLGELYPSGDEAPPAHPNCRCVIVAELTEEE